LVDQLQPQAGAVTVAHPLLVKLISAARVKTDTRDTINLARLLAAKLIPQVWVPPEEVRELRALLAHRRRLISNRTQARNRLHSVLHRHNLVPPAGDLFAPAMRDWWQALALPFSERLRIRQDLGLLDTLEPLIAEVDAELVRLSTAEEWAEQVPFLVHLPGIGILTAMTLLSAIGDITRFRRQRSWSATVVWALVCMTRAKPIAVERSPNRADAICGRQWLRLPGSQSGIIPIGELNLFGWPSGAASAGRSWRLRASCWLWSGMCSANTRSIGTRM
jgi:hypothetical protein